MQQAQPEAQSTEGEGDMSQEVGLGTPVQLSPICAKIML